MIITIFVIYFVHAVPQNFSVRRMYFFIRNGHIMVEFYYYIVMTKNGKERDAETEKKCSHTDSQLSTRCHRIVRNAILQIQLEKTKDHDTLRSYKENFENSAGLLAERVFCRSKDVY